MIALTCWGIGEMALKTGYKVNNKEIILDDYSKYGDSSIIDTCTETLDGYYKVNNNNIKASYYIDGKGQIAAELPGDNYYKAPNGAQKFALYGTNTVGGWIHEKESVYWEKFEGNGVGEEDKIINIMFDGQKLGIAETAGGGSIYYIPNDDSHIIRKYVDDDGKFVYPPYIKIWVYAVAAGGGGGTGYPQIGGGGGGASGTACIRMSVNDVITAIIPKRSGKGETGGDLSLTLNKPSGSINLLTLGGGKAGGNLSSGDGGDSTKGTISYNLIDVFTIKGGKGGEVGKGEDESYDGQGRSFYPNTKADYYILYKSLTVAGGTGKSTHTTSMAFNMGGGGASAFPGGKGGSGTFVGKWDEETYNVPGPGGGGGGAYGSDNNYGYSGAGAFWILYA